MTKKIPRRSFLKEAGTVGIFTLTTSNVFALAKIQPTSLNTTKYFIDKISKKTYNLQALKDLDVLSIYKTALSNWQHNGYEAQGSTYYVCQHRELALFPLRLENESIGLLDQAILCFEKNQVGEWIKLKALSGFDLEALNAAATGLQLLNPAVELADYLLPNLSLTHENPFCFNTEKGDVFIKTFINNNNSNTEIIVKEGSKTLFQEIISTSCSLA